jgi:hypothetical protein
MKNRGKKKEDDGYDLKIFIVINAHKKHLMFSYPYIIQWAQQSSQQT